jgi:transcriptional/translational regulatory protein YebC/TACO1
LRNVKGALNQVGLKVEDAEVTQLPTTTIPVDEKTAPKVLRLIDALEDLDDVQSVYSNFDIADDVMAELAAGS